MSFPGTRPLMLLMRSSVTISKPFHAPCSLDSAAVVAEDNILLNTWASTCGVIRSSSIRTTKWALMPRRRLYSSGQVCGYSGWKWKLALTYAENHTTFHLNPESSTGAIKQSINQSNNRSKVNPSTNQSINRMINQKSIHRSINQSIGRSINQWFKIERNAGILIFLCSGIWETLKTR